MKTMMQAGLVVCWAALAAGCGLESQAPAEGSTDALQAELNSRRCRTDADCRGGTVCEGCGTGPKTCVTGCRSNVTCPDTSDCLPVTCVACPCPNQCVVTPPPPKSETQCANGLDDDGDGLVDCQDPDCIASGSCNCLTTSAGGCCYPKCGANEVLSCIGKNICGYPCTCVALTTAKHCKSDAECAAGTVCEGCAADGSDARCVTGCRAGSVTTTAQCKPGQTCTTVQCVTCPCPAQCL